MIDYSDCKGGKEAILLADKFKSHAELRDAFVYLCTIIASHPLSPIENALAYLDFYYVEKGIIPRTENTLNNLSDIGCYVD